MKETSARKALLDGLFTNNPTFIQMARDVSHPRNHHGDIQRFGNGVGDHRRFGLF